MDNARSAGTQEDSLDQLLRQNNNFAGVQVGGNSYAPGQMGSGSFGMDDYASIPRFAGTSPVGGADVNGDSPNYLRGNLNVLGNVNVGADPYGLAAQDDMSRTVTIGKNQGVLAALGAAGYTSAEAKAYYGQMIASGQIGRNGIVQPGQELSFTADDFSQSKLGGRAIAAESAYRAERMAVAVQSATRLSEWGDSTTVIAGLGLPSQASRSAVDQIPTGGYAYAPPAKNAPEGFFGQVAGAIDRFNNTGLGQALQGLPPEGFILGAVKSGVNFLGKAERVAAELGAGERATGSGKTVTLYRVDDAGFAPRIAADGSVPVVTTGSGSERALFVNIGQPLRAQEFALINRNGNATVTAVDVDVSLLEELRATSVYDKSAATKLNPTAPLRVDINKAPDQFGLRTPQQIQMLRDAINPSTVRIVDPRTLR